MQKTREYIHTTDNFSVVISFPSERIGHIRKCKSEKLLNEQSLIVGKENRIEFRYEESSDSTIIETELMFLGLNKKTGTIEFKDKNRKSVLEDVTFEFSGNEYGSHSIKQKFMFDDDEGLYGLGQYQEGIMNYRNHKVILSQSNRTLAVPFLTSTRGYGILWDNCSWTEFESKDSVGSFYSKVGDVINYYFIYGESVDGTISEYRDLTGIAPMYSKWAYGFWQCKERYKSFEELENVVKEYRKRNIPIDVIVQDWKYWGGLGWSALEFDENIYPDPEKHIKTIHDKYNCKIMTSVWPSIGKKSKVGQELDKNGMLFPYKCWNDGYVYDAYNPKARNIYWKHVKKGLLDKGVDAFWLDGSEPEFATMQTPEEFEEQLYPENCYLGKIEKYYNPYVLKAVQALHDGLSKDAPNRRAYILTRSAFTGLQKYGATSWSGDIGGNWDVFKKQISAGLNFCMAGIPYWTHDIGGFFINQYPDGCEDPEYRELYLRWLQFGVFSPIFRSHGTNTPREVWRFGNPGEQIYEALIKFIRLRYRLLPYIYSCAAKVTHDGYTIMRGLPMDFPDDKKCYEINDQYMFGPSILVAPVTERMYNKSQYTEIKQIDAEFLSAENGQNGRLTGYYYKKSSFKDLLRKQSDKTVDFDWSGGAPKGLTFDDYSMRWKGKIFSNVSGEHKISVTGVSVRVTINNKCIIDELDQIEKPNQPYCESFYFEKNKKYNIKIEFNRTENCAQIFLKWKKPNQNIHSEECLDTTKIKTKNVYLPAGCDWYDFWNGSKYKGGEVVVVEAPLGKMPLFVKAGSLIPLGPEKQFAAEESNSPLILMVYPGKNCEFTLYDDDGETYDYRRGVHSKIKIAWDDKNKKLNIGKQIGDYKGKTEEFKIITVDENIGCDSIL